MALSLEEGPAVAAGANTRQVAASQGDTAHGKQSYTEIWPRLRPGLCCKLLQAPAGVSSGGSRRRSMGPPYSRSARTPSPRNRGRAILGPGGVCLDSALHWWLRLL